jgi:hypothetical protein
VGIFSDIFGGSTTIDPNTSQSKQDLNQLFNQFSNYDPGLGAAGQMAKGYLKDVRQGKMGDLPSVQLAVAQGANNWKNLQRTLQMNSAAYGGQQPGLAGGLLMKGQLANQDQTGMQALSGAANDISNFSNIFSQARGQRINANLQGGQLGLEAAMGLQNKIGSTPGILGALAATANSAAKMSGGLG